MDKNSLIYTLFITQKDVLKSIKDSKEMKNLFNSTLDSDRKIRKLIKPYPNIVELYDELETAEVEYLSAAEFNAFYHGFKAGLQIAIECGLPANT